MVGKLLRGRLSYSRLQYYGLGCSYGLLGFFTREVTLARVTVGLDCLVAGGRLFIFDNVCVGLGVLCEFWDLRDCLLVFVFRRVLTADYFLQCFVGGWLFRELFVSYLGGVRLLFVREFVLILSKLGLGLWLR